MMPPSFASLPLPQQQQIDLLCVEFEQRWLESPHPDLLHLVEQAPADVQEPLLIELAKIDATYRRRRGERVAAQLYVESFPHLEEPLCNAIGHRRPRSSDEDRLQQGDIVQRYRIVRWLGGGEYADVFLARDESLGRDVALKTLRHREDDELLMEEARTAAKLRHPNIAAVFDTGRLDDDRLFVVMEYVNGRSLRHELEDDQAEMDVERCSRIVAQVADALDAAHQQGVIHRDICPENILLDGSDNAKVADFGLAIHECRQADRLGEIAGSAPYMAPEQYQAKSAVLDGRADIWSLGVVFYELLSGRRPFGGATMEEIRREVVDREPKPLSHFGLGTPETISHLCMECLHKDVGKRMSSAGELRDRLRSLSGRRRTRNRTLVGLLAVAAAVACFAMLPPRKPVMPSVPSAPRIEVLIHRGGQVAPLSLANPWLQGGDSVYLEASVQQPRYLHAWWIDGEGKVQRLSEARVAAKTNQARYPKDAQLAWPLPAEQPGGVDTIVLLASDASSIPDDWRNELGRIKMKLASKTSSKLAAWPAWFVDGQRATVPSRSLPDEASPMEDPLGQWHVDLASRLGQHGELFAVSFPCRNEPKTPAVAPTP